MEQQYPVHPAVFADAPAPVSPVLNYRDAAVALDVPCPLCGYNLRGQSEPRCPECGYRFDWKDLLDPARKFHLYLFEFHPKRNFWSFWRTLVGGLRPWQFWSVLRPDQASRPHRLLLYWVLTALVGLVGAASVYVGVLFATDWDPAEGVRLVGPAYLFWWAWGLLWPWLTFLTLMIFRASMRRARVKTVHVLRCVLYSSDVALWPALAAAAASAVVASISLFEGSHFWFWHSQWGVVYQLMNTAYLLASVFAALKLVAAYQRYLKFDHAVATVVAAQVIVVLFALVVAVNLILLFGIR